MIQNTLSVGDIVEVTADRLAYGGDAVARYEGLAIFIPFAAPQERLRVRITERKKTFARAVIEELLQPSPARRDALCPYFGDCGGCQLQHITYDAQLEAKIGFVRDALERIGRIDWTAEIKIHRGAEFGYRGRAQVKIDRKTGRIGFSRGGSNSVCDIDSCPILTPELDAAFQSLHLTLRESPAAGAVPGNILHVDLAAGDSGVAFDPALGALPGGVLTRTVNGAVYNFGASTFFQANPGLLNELVDEAVGNESGRLAIDLYAGVGLFTVQLARRFARVIGIEGDRNTARFAYDNIKANSLLNVEFHNDAVESWLKNSLEATALEPDLLVLDPPRTGAADAIDQIVTAHPTRIIYVSCNPSTLARDLRQLIDSGYELTRVTAVDLFPQTYHVETIAVLARK